MAAAHENEKISDFVFCSRPNGRCDAGHDGDILVPAACAHFVAQDSIFLLTIESNALHNNAVVIQ